MITPEEPARLEKAAHNLGLYPRQLLRPEQAMAAAVKPVRFQITEHYERSAASAFLQCAVAAVSTGDSSSSPAPI